MGNVIDAVHDAMMKIESNRSNFLDEDFMKGILSRIYKDGTLQFLEDANIFF